MQKFRISNDRGEYIMNRGAQGANQHAGKCVDGTWQTNGSARKECMGWAKVEFCDIVALT